MALRRVPPETYTLTPRLDILAVGQQQAIQSTTSRSTILAEDEAIVLLGALAYGHGQRYAAVRDEDPHRYAEAALKQAGLLCGATVERQCSGVATHAAVSTASRRF